MGALTTDVLVGRGGVAEGGRDVGLLGGWDVGLLDGCVIVVGLTGSRVGGAGGFVGRGLVAGVLVGVAVTTITMAVGGGRVGVTTITMAVGCGCRATLHALTRIKVAQIKENFFITVCSTCRSLR